MNPTETLSKPKPCRRCGGEIPSGTPLSALEWDRGERAWAHRKPSSDEVRETASKGSPVPHHTGGPTSSVEAPVDPKTHSAPGRPLRSNSERGAWSVTVEIHEAEDTAQSKRVLRIARLHLGSYVEAREVAEQLRKES